VSAPGRTGRDPVGWLVRVAWGRRLETGLTFATVVARVGLAGAFGPSIASIALLVSGLALVVNRPTREWMVGLHRRERLERHYARVFAAVGIEHSGAPSVLGQHPMPTGVVLDLELSPRCTAKDLATRTEPLAVALGAASVRVREDRTAAGRAQLVVANRDPLTGAPIPWPWIGIGQLGQVGQLGQTDRTHLWDGLPLGHDEDDGLVVLELAGHHLLLGGEPGAGKSNALSLIVAASALDPDVELWCFDGKLVELAAWRECARRFVGADIEDATEALGELRTVMEDRYSVLLDRGLRKVDRETGLGLIVVVIDELALYTQGKGKVRDEFVEVLRDIVARGRAAGIVVVAATQKPASDIVPTSIRDLFGCRLAMRCSTRDASDTVLGAGWATEGYSASDISPANRGVGHLLAEGSLPRRMRCFVLEDRHVHELAKRAAELRGGRS
jgi:hypothetical protein